MADLPKIFGLAADSDEDCTGELALESLGELLAKPPAPPNWLVQGLLLSGSLSLIVAKPKVGKSLLARRLSLCVARGEPFLGRDVKQGSVIYLVLEERPEDVVSDFRSMGATPDDPIQIACRADVLTMVNTVNRRSPALLVVDPLFRMISARDATAYAEISACMSPLINVARETGTHIACLHHSPKQAREDAIDSPLGSTALGGAVSTLIELRRNPDTQMRTIRSTQRRGTDLEETVLRLDPDSRQLHLDGTRKEHEVSGLKLAIWAALGDTPLTEPQIFDAVEHGKTGPKRTALRSLFKDGKVERTGGGRRGDPYLYRKAGFHVPAPIENSGNDRPSKDKTSSPENVVSTSAFMYGNERNEIFSSPEVVAGTSEILVPTEARDRAISTALGNEYSRPPATGGRSCFDANSRVPSGRVMPLRDDEITL